MTVMAFVVRHNDELIRDLAELGWLDRDMRTLDPTYGEGRFWKLWRPRKLVRTDLNPALSPDRPDGVNYHDMPWRRDSFDAVTFDPYYKLSGTSSGKGPAALDPGYGEDGYMPWQERHADCKSGARECIRVLRPLGTLVWKCQDQVCSGAVRWQTKEFTDYAEALGMRLVDRLHTVGHRVQPKGRKQKHAANNYATALVFTKPRASRRKAAKPAR